MSVVYVKLLSGEEIIGDLQQDDGVKVTLSEPLAMESGMDEREPGRRYVYMSRFAPYAQSTVVDIKHAAVAMLMPVSPEVGRYYIVSLDYCRRASDVKFREGITETTTTIEDMVSAMENPALEDDRRAQLEEALEGFLLASVNPSSNTQLN